MCVYSENNKTKVGNLEGKSLQLLVDILLQFSIRTRKYNFCGNMGEKKA